MTTHKRSVKPSAHCVTIRHFRLGPIFKLKYVNILCTAGHKPFSKPLPQFFTVNKERQDVRDVISQFFDLVLNRQRFQNEALR